jgi:ornithine decarboxylase
MKYEKLSEKIKEKLKIEKTPFLIYNLNKIYKNVEEFKKIINPDKLFFAVKSNNDPKILREIKNADCYFELNNINEVESLKKAGVKNFSNCINSLPVTTSENIKSLYNLGIIYFAVKSKRGIDKIKENAPNSNIYVRLFTSNEGSRFDLTKFGVDYEKTIELLKYAKKVGLNPIGVTFHPGSQCLNLDNWKKGIEKCGRVFKELPFLKIVNIGGGFPSIYKNGKIPTLKEIAETINKSLDDNFEKRPIIYAEPGRFIAGNSGIIVTSVIEVDNEQKMVYADMPVTGGLYELPEGNWGLKYIIKPIDKKKENEKKFIIYDPTCAGTGVLDYGTNLPISIKNKDRLEIRNTGAYSLNYASPNFNGHKPPKVFYVKNGKLLE